MSTAAQRAKERYEKRLTKSLLTEEALMLLDPYSFCIEQAYYEHRFDRLAFINDSLEYSIPGSLITLPTLYFAGFGRPAASEIYAKFQAAPVSKNPYFKFRMIARTHLQQKGRHIRTKVVQPKTTREALDYMGDLKFLADELENKYMDSELAFGRGAMDLLPLALITDLP